MRPLISKKSFSCIIIGSAVMSYIIKYVIEKLGDPIGNSSHNDFNNISSLFV